jgi:chloride channel protein, CIC family
MKVPDLRWFYNQLDRFRHSEFILGTTLSIIVGILAGLSAVLFRWLINFFHKLFFINGADILSFMGQYYVIIVPAIGGLIIGAIIYFTHTSETKGHGVPEVMAAVSTAGGRIRTRVAAIKILVSSICIGSGGSVGREGPIVQIGSAVGSVLGQRLHLSQDWVKSLVACGAAGGISATFNAPIAGVFFATEVILGRFLPRRFGFVVMSSVVASVIAHSLLGDEITFQIPTYHLTSHWELLLYFLLGIISAFVAVLFIRVLNRSEDLFDRLKMPEYLKPGLGGIVIGLLGLYSPFLFGVGYEGVEQALHGNIGIVMLITLLLFKIAATSITLGSGGSGGVFAPSLFMGAMFGGLFGSIANYFLPNITSPSGAYALVGMAAVFSAAARAPITAIIIIFEMTRDYAIILPLMLAVVVGTIIAHQINPLSIYGEKLNRRGIQIKSGEEKDVLEKVRVEEVMTRDYPSVTPDMLLSDVMRMLVESRHHGFPVTDENGQLTGIITLADVETRLSSGDENLTVADVATTEVITAYPDETLHDVVHRLLGTNEIGRIPIVERKDPLKLIGMLRRRDLVKAYAKGLSRSIREEKE